MRRLVTPDGLHVGRGGRPDGRAVVTERDSARVLLVTPPDVSKGASKEQGEVEEIGRIPETDPRGEDYSGDRVRRSVEESMQRLGLDRLPLVHLHDPESFALEYVAAPGGAVDALVALREQGVVGSIGLAGGDVRVMARYLALEVFDVLLVHNRWTLVDRSAGALIAEAHRQGMGVLNAAVYGGGILAHQDAAGSPTSYGYRPASQPLLDAVESMRAVCARYGADLPTAALRFSVRDDGFASTIVGMSRPERVPVTVAAAQAALPDDLFAELETLLPAPEHWLDAPL